MASTGNESPCHEETSLVASSSSAQNARADSDSQMRSGKKTSKTIIIPASAIRARIGPLSTGLPRPGRRFTPATYPPLPPDYKSTRRHWLLGWNLDEPWAEEFCQTRVSPHLRKGASTPFAILRYVLHHTRCKPVITIQPALLPDAKLASVSEIEAGLAKDEDVRNEDIALLTICSTITKKLFEEKLRKRVYDWLVERFGEPKWYKNMFTKEDAAEAYYEYL
ncbi:hypothetical protein K474DRAFT_1771802 [Panus rudis PR-1116 ss-1]|nr:hypothetical protein K474DRAFT_1771802 [Panus rudis PR-1116 ss-1]